MLDAESAARAPMGVRARIAANEPPNCLNMSIQVLHWCRKIQRRTTRDSCACPFSDRLLKQRSRGELKAVLIQKCPRFGPRPRPTPLGFNPPRSMAPAYLSKQLPPTELFHQSRS